MSSMIKGAMLTVAGVAMVASPALAADIEKELREMREMVLQLQDQVQSQQGQIDGQRDVIREAGLEDEDGAVSALSSFLESTDFGGWVAASYFWNFNRPDGSNARDGVDGAAGQPFSNPFHPEHNSFQFDEAWFVVDRAPTEESPAGFHFEIVYGATATAFSQLDSNGVTSTGNLNGNDIWIPAANVSYMAPWDQQFTMGKFGTTIGYEVAGAPSNVNITRGFTYNLFQPISHVGLKTHQEFDNGLSYTLGIVNGFETEQPDSNWSKAFLWGLGFSTDTASASFNGIYDRSRGGSVDDTYVLDVVAEITPTDNFLAWLNFDYLNEKVGTDNPDGIGLSVGSRFAITEQFGIGGRVEYGHFDDDGAIARDGDLWSLTATTDYALTENLIWKVEAKYERATSNNVAFGSTAPGAGTAACGNGAISGCEPFIHGKNTGNRDDMFMLGTQVYYTF